MKKIVIFGDWHNNFTYAQKILQHYETNNPADTYLHTGDFGIWRSTEMCEKVNSLMETFGKEIWIIPGNHEDYDLIDQLPSDDRGLLKVGSNLFIVPRGYKWIWNGVRFAGLGGAFSIDYRSRTLGKDWFKQEVITEQDYLKTVEGDNDIDLLITHDSPRIPYGRKGIEFFDPEITKLNQQSSYYISKVCVEKNVKVLFHGHHHTHYYDMFYNTFVVGLDMDHSAFNKNSVMIDLDVVRDAITEYQPLNLVLEEYWREQKNFEV